jgi:hypothetical protein
MILYIRKGTCSDLHGIPEALQQANSRTTACVRNSMKFKITDTCTMCTCSERFLILWKYATVPEAKKN